MTVKEKFITFEKIGMTLKEFYHMIVFKELSEEEQHTAALYEKVKILTPSKVHSSAHFYQTVREMHEKHNWLQGTPNGRKVVFRLTESGRKQRENYFSLYYARLASVTNISQHFIQTIKGKKNTQNTHVKTPFAEEDQRFFSKLINVRNLIQFFILQNMVREQRNIYGYELYGKLSDFYGWQCSDGYFYEMLHEMESLKWIKGKWDDPELRRKKIYSLQPDGYQVFPIVEKKAFESLLSLHNFISEVLVVFHLEDETEKLKLLQEKGG